MDKEHIIEKIRKLMSLQESAKELGNEGEANAAAAGISRLLMEYDLLLEDVDDLKKKDSPIGHDLVEVRVDYITAGHWFENLIAVLCSHNRCLSLKSNRNRFEIVGRKENRTVVLYLISFLSEKFIRIGRRNYPEWKYKYILRTGITPPPLATYMKSFLTGCTWGLDEKLTEEMQVCNTDAVTALTKNYLEENKSYVEEEFNLCKGKRQRSITLDHEITEEGRKTGRNVEINRGITSEKTENTSRNCSLR